MLPCSVRCVAATGAQSSFLSTIPRITATRTYRPSSRRRYSSSKPSRDNGSEDPPVRQSVQPASEAKAGEAKAPGEKRKRKTKDTSDKLKFPSVPTTANIPSDFIALSSFFSLHRPISITRGLPRNVTTDAFAAIFVPPSRGAKAADVISTLSRTVDDLDNNSTSRPQHGAQRTLSLQQQEAIAEAEAHNEQLDQQRKLELLNADSADISVQVNNMAGQFLPFRPPPLPQAESAASRAQAAAARQQAATTFAADAALEESSADLVEEVQKRVYKAVFTIEETTDAHGEVKIVAHSPELIEDTEASSAPSRSARGKQAAARMTISVDGDGGRADSSVTSSEQEQEQGPLSQPFLRRMRSKQLNFQRAETRLQQTRWWMISVKRQRKLKMKKKKYKKLTRRLRHEKAKQGRT